MDGKTYEAAFAGSGTALQVAQRLGRKYVGMELNDEYIKIEKKNYSSWNKFFNELIKKYGLPKM